MRLVDHEKRRCQIAGVALELIAREGLEATTLNRIAQEMGASIRVVTHYFADKDALLLAAYRMMAEQSREHIAAAVERDPTDLVGLLMALCGTDEVSLNRWKAYVAFWGKADRAPALAEEQRRASEQAQATIGKVIMARHPTQAYAGHIPMELLAIVYGISVLRILDPESWNLSSVQAAVERAVRNLRL